MEFSSIAQYEGQQVRLTLTSGFWYKAKILSCSKDCITFIELKGRTISVSPSQIVLIEGGISNE
jgi:hypothetical protein